MPEELGIALVILIVVGWLIVKALQALVAFADDRLARRRNARTKKNIRRELEKKGRLSQQVRVVLPDQLDLAERTLELAELELKKSQRAENWTAVRPTWTKKEFTRYPIPSKNENYIEMDAEDVIFILTPNAKTWLEQESRLIAQECLYPALLAESKCLEFTDLSSVRLELDEAVFQYDNNLIKEKDVIRYFESETAAVAQYNNRRLLISERCENLNEQIQAWNRDSRLRWEAYAEQSRLFAEEEQSEFIRFSQRYTDNCKEEQRYFRAMSDGYRNRVKKAVVSRVDYVLSNLALPNSVPRVWDADFDDEHQILIVEIGLPDVVHHPPYKTVQQKRGDVEKPLNQTEKKEIVPKVHPAILLRVACEVLRNDDAEIIKLLVLNGWVRFDDPRTGVNRKAYTASLVVEPNQLASLNLNKIDPLAAFDNLHGKSAGRLIEIIPIEPTLSLNRKDSRFVDAKEVLNVLSTATNLAAMDWQDFEHLIRELFEKEFSGRGAEVKITQASRDRGVDAIVFDPDPIHGGKYVIQAKRYTNTVDVSAVRDLCAVVKKEGASRGILVTTSTYGADAFAFANNEPITLLNGAELLGLLKKHGYGFRIDLQEARKLNLKTPGGMQ
jgi:restriction system protein